MKSLFLLISIFSFFLWVSSLHGAELANTGSMQMIATGTVENPLLVAGTSVEDDTHLMVNFNQEVIQESVRIRVTKQSDGSNVKIDTLTWATSGDKKTVAVVFSDLLEPNTTYKITIVSAISQSGVVIKDGADALYEFSTSSTLKRSTPILNAPANPNAVIVTTKTGSENTLTGTNAEKQQIEELPLTGMNPALFLLIALLIAFWIVSLRKKA